MVAEFHRMRALRRGSPRSTGTMPRNQAASRPGCAGSGADPNSGSIYTLNSVAAVVLGGVSLLGGVGGLIAPIAAAFILTLVKTLMILRGVDQNYAQVIQGALIVLVVMVGGLAIRQKAKGA